MKKTLPSGDRTCGHCGGLHYGSYGCVFICPHCNRDIRPDANPRCECAAEAVSEPQQDTPVVPCIDCGRPYPHGLDMILTKMQWCMVNPDDGGVLCPSCIVNRAAKMPGSISVFAYIAFAADYDSPADSIGKILVALRLENADYCRETLEARHRITELEEEHARWRTLINGHLVAAREERDRAIADAALAGTQPGATHAD